MHMLTSVASRHAPRIRFSFPPFHKYVRIIGSLISLCHLQLLAVQREGTARQQGRLPMDQGTMELKGCVCRIKSCAVELVSMEEDLATDLDDDSWDLVGRDLGLKAAFLYIDLSRVIARSEGEERRKALTRLANELFYFMEEVI
jgi:photosystem II oxygen-evolving enhancer protein 3